MKTAERAQARKLRREEGRSVKELAELLRVSRSTISLWVRDIELTDEQHEALSTIRRWEDQGLECERRAGARKTSRGPAPRPGRGSAAWRA